MKGGRSRVLHRHGRLVHPWAPPGPREHRGRLSPGRCARRTRGGEGAAFFGSFWCATQQGTCTLAERIRGVYRARGGGGVGGLGTPPRPTPGAAHARSKAQKRQFALPPQMRAHSTPHEQEGGSAVQRRVKRPSDGRCAHVNSFGSSSPIFTLKLGRHAPRRADSSAHGGQHDGESKPSLPELGASSATPEGHGRTWKDSSGPCTS